MDSYKIRVGRRETGPSVREPSPEDELHAAQHMHGLNIASVLNGGVEFILESTF